MARKYEAIDILKLYSGTLKGFEDDFKIPIDDPKICVFDVSGLRRLLNSHEKWNLWLARCYETCNINELAKVRYSLQAGMDDLVKKKMVTDKIAIFFARTLRSIEKTAERIIKKKHPLANDLANKRFHTIGSLEAKRRRDIELERFWKKSAY